MKDMVAAFLLVRTGPPDVSTRRPGRSLRDDPAIAPKLTHVWRLNVQIVEY
jgi:hypothetical protein